MSLPCLGIDVLFLCTAAVLLSPPTARSFSLSLSPFFDPLLHTNTNRLPPSSSLSWPFLLLLVTASNRLAFRTVRVSQAMALFHTFSLILFGESDVVFLFFFFVSLFLSPISLSPIVLVVRTLQFGALVAPTAHSFVFASGFWSPQPTPKRFVACCSCCCWRW